MKIIKAADLHYYDNDQMNRVYSARRSCPCSHNGVWGDVK